MRRLDSCRPGRAGSRARRLRGPGAGGARVWIWGEGQQEQSFWQIYEGSVDFFFFKM